MMSKEMKSIENKPSVPLTPETDADTMERVVEQERSNALVLKKQRKVRILIPSGRSPHEQAPVAVGVNGRSFLIERDKEVVVPESVLHVLNLSQEQVPVVDDEGKSTMRVRSFRSVPRFPVQVKGYEES